MKLKQNYLLALLSAFIMWLAWPPHNWLAPLLFVGLVPLLVALKQITTNAENKTGKKVVLDIKIDDSIIGGGIVRINDDVIDGSIKRQMENIKNTF